MNELATKILASEIRRFLAVIAGGIGLSSGADPVDIIAAAILYALTSVWGYFKNKKVQKVEDKAARLEDLDRVYS